jgi:hypothetical protein
MFGSRRFVDWIQYKESLREEITNFFWPKKFVDYGAWYQDQSEIVIDGEKYPFSMGKMPQGYEIWCNGIRMSNDVDTYDVALNRHTTAIKLRKKTVELLESMIKEIDQTKSYFIIKLNHKEFTDLHIERLKAKNA